jgi:hypothetical protein
MKGNKGREESEGTAITSRGRESMYVAMKIKG